MQMPQDREAIAAEVAEQRERDEANIAAQADQMEQLERDREENKVAPDYGSVTNPAYPTTNETPVEGAQPAGGPEGTGYVTGADGEPVPADQGVQPAQPDLALTPEQRAAQEQGAPAADQPVQAGEPVVIERADQP